MDEPWSQPAELRDRNAQAKAANQFILSVVQGAQVVESFMRRTGAKLGGSYVNTNHGFAFGEPPTKEKAFIIGDFIVVDPSSTVRFDELMCLKEDYDFTANHIATYGRVCRLNRLFVKAIHYSNEGGAVADRNAKKEDRMIAHLRKKWGEKVFTNQRRKHEVIMKADKVKVRSSRSGSAKNICDDCGKAFLGPVWTHAFSCESAAARA
jgi:hypothetical protein